MKVRILGSGSGIPIVGHYNESVLVRTEGASYLIDAGEPCAATIITEALRKHYGLPPSQVGAGIIDAYSIRAIFISHFDADHVGGLPMLLQTMHLWQKRGEAFRFRPENRLRLYMPEEAIDPFQNFLRVLHLVKLNYILEIFPIREGVFYEDDAVAVSAFLNGHLKPEHSYSFSLEAEGRRIVYSGDLGNEREILPLLKDVDLLIVECAHFSPEGLFQALQGQEVRKVVVNHIHPSLYGHEKEIVGMGEKYLDCDILVGIDNLEINV